MIQFLADSIDQLDLALDQLAVNDRNFDRFALMLVDNVVELVLHKYAQNRASENRMWGAIDEPRNNPKQVAKALGQNFDQKVKACCHLGLIDQALRDSLLYLHQFRNTVYHRGLRHEGILHSLALFYFSCACQVLTLYEPSWWVWGSNDKISHRARKYVGSPTTVADGDVFKYAFVRLAEVAESMPQDLVGDLSADLGRTVTQVDEMIHFLATGGPEQKSRDQVIVDVQAWAFAFTDEAKMFARDKGCTESCVGPYVEWIGANYPWPIKRDPIDGWRKRHRALVSESDRHRTLKKYVDFMKQTEDIRGKIDESAAQLDGWIQEQIDRSRGK